MLTAADRQGYLLNLAWNAEDADASLYSVIKAAIRGSFRDTNAGRMVVSTSGNGRSTSVLIPDFLKTMTHDDVRRWFVQLLSVYNATRATLGLAVISDSNEDEKDNDAAIVAAMLDDDKLQPVTQFQNDFTALRWQQ